MKKKNRWKLAKTNPTNKSNTKWDETEQKLKGRIKKSKAKKSNVEDEWKWIKNQIRTKNKSKQERLKKNKSKKFKNI